MHPHDDTARTKAAQVARGRMLYQWQGALKWPEHAMELTCHQGVWCCLLSTQLGRPGGAALTHLQALFVAPGLSPSLTQQPRPTLQMGPYKPLPSEEGSFPPPRGEAGPQEGQLEAGWEVFDLGLLHGGAGGGRGVRNAQAHDEGLLAVHVVGDADALGDLGPGCQLSPAGGRQPQ